LKKLEPPFPSQNVEDIVVTLATFQLPIFALKSLATNVRPMFLTRATFQAPRSCTKTQALLNMLEIVVTLATFQGPIGWLKFWLSKNMEAMFDTEATFHAPMLLLNVVSDLNNSNIHATALVSQEAMAPYVAAAVSGLATHKSAAVLMLP
jgi:hypothetical protein